MNAAIYQTMPSEALKIRKQVFITEQGFQDEFDEIDAVAVHIVQYTDSLVPIGTCRIYQKENGDYILGRLAVLKEYRQNGVGAAMVREAERYISQEGGTSISLHAQCRVRPFYEKLGYAPYGEIELEQGCPHIWMAKTISAGACACPAGIQNTL